jgi:hypothetical protein
LCIAGPKYPAYSTGRGLLLGSRRERERWINYNGIISPHSQPLSLSSISFRETENDKIKPGARKGNRNPAFTYK